MELIPRTYCADNWLRNVIAGRNNMYSFVCNFGDDVLISKRVYDADHLYIVKDCDREDPFHPPNRPNRIFEVHAVHLPWSTKQDDKKVDAYVENLYGIQFDGFGYLIGGLDIDDHRQMDREARDDAIERIRFLDRDF